MSLDNLQTASFRGVAFLIGDLDTEGGRKNITREYPNSDRRTNEDLGLLGKTFTLNGVIKTQEDFTEKNRLIAALEQSGPGELVHPTFGTVTVSLSGPYRVSERIGELGVARFSMTFERTDSPIFPTQTSVKPSLIKDESDTAIDGVATDVADTFEVSTSSTSNYTAAREKLQSIGSTFQEIGRATSAVTSTISQYTASVTNFIDGITRNIFEPAELAASIKDMFLELDQIAPNAIAQFELAKQLFGFGSSDTLVQPTTVARQQRADNQLLLNNAITANALSLAYNNAANIDYANELEVLEARQTLEAEYQDIIEDNILSGDTLDALANLRNSSRLFFEDISITVSKIRPVTVNTIPMSVLSYQYYGSTDNTEALIDLNAIADVSFVEGEVQILTP